MDRRWLPPFIINSASMCLNIAAALMNLGNGAWIIPPAFGLLFAGTGMYIAYHKLFKD